MLKSVVALCLIGAVVCGPPVSRTRAEIQEFRDFLEGTRTEGGVVLHPSDNPKNAPEGSTWEYSGKYQGDILLDDEEIESMVEQYSQGRNAYLRPHTHWPHRVVVYEFAAGHFDNDQRNYILYCMSLIESRTCIRFRHRHHNEFNFVRVTGNPTGCHANVGFSANRGAHTLNLARERPGHGCFNPVTIIHEWLHIIGFFHMQSTYNRYDFVRINWANIIRGREHNFDRFGHNVVSNLGLPYQYDSCMHYRPFSFSSNGRPTIDATRPLHVQMGQRDYVTGYDLWRVDRHYGCMAWKMESDYRPLYFNGSLYIDEKTDIKSDYEDVKVEPINLD